MKKIDMLFLLQKLIYAFILNVSFFLILMIAIQNSYEKRKVDLIVNETVFLPISFIVGASFISGTLTGSLLTINPVKKED